MLATIAARSSRPPRPIPPVLADMRLPSLTRNLAEELTCRSLGRYAGAVSRIRVDKMPHNYLRLGLISMLFPRARIIHCRRDPMDVCASAYFQNFKFMPHAARLEDIAFYYVPVHEVDGLLEAACSRCRFTRWYMKKWSPTLEAMSLQAGHRLRAGVGTRALPCLFTAPSGPCKRRASCKLRQPIYHRAVGRWKPFQAHLEPLRMALGIQ